MIKYALLILICLALSFAFRTSPPAEVDSEVIIRNIKDAKGTLIISVYNDAAGFPKVGKELVTEKMPVKDTLPHTVHIKVPAEGWYAIAMFQDEDDNGKIKQDKVGIPEEPYGFSNNVHPRVEAPNFKSCKYHIGSPEDKPIEIRLIQPRFHGKL